MQGGIAMIGDSVTNEALTNETSPHEETTNEATAHITSLAKDLVDALAAVLSCSRHVIELAVITFLAGGHLLLEDVPGVGKTTLARAMSIAIGGSARRIQFTPDLLPSDLTGVSIYDQSTETFIFHQGPLFANIIIADEINRANPKTQSAMLEAMGEQKISVDGDTYDLSDPYFVVATQNPIELEGTYPLPEAQLDRFMVCTSFGYPDAHAESQMLATSNGMDPLRDLRQVCTREQVLVARESCAAVHMDSDIADYIVELVRSTRHQEDVSYGASPRGSLYLASLARARAFAEGRSFVLADDVQALAVPVLAHRLVLRDAEYGIPSMLQARSIMERIVSSVAVPRAERQSGTTDSSR
jgi:MoxR-like ATPase